MGILDAIQGRGGHRGAHAPVRPATGILRRFDARQLSTVGDIGSGAGGLSSGCDLAVATRFATLIVCQSGFGGDGFLRWTTEPTSQEEKIDDVVCGAYQSILSRCRPAGRCSTASSQR